MNTDTRIPEARYIFIDVETIPRYDEAVRDSLRPPKTHKKPEAIDAWRSDQFTDKGGLNTHTGEVATLSCAVNGMPVQTWLIDHPNYPDSTDTMRLWPDAIAPHITPQTVFVAHNWAFDGPMIEAMLIDMGRHDIRRRMADAFAVSPYKGRTRDVYDTMIEYPATGRNNYVSLSVACARFGIVPPTGDGADVANQWDDGDVAEIVAHNQDDVRATRELFCRMAGIRFDGMDAYETGGKWTAKLEG